MGLIEDYVRLNMFPDEEGNFNDRFIAFLARSFIGTGDPEGVVAAPVASAFWRVDGGAGTILYVKESGSGNTGWVAYGAGGGGGGGFTQEQVEDIVGAMFSGNTETGIAATYQDADGTIDLVAEVTQAELDAHDHDLDYDPIGTAVAEVDAHEAAADPHTGYLKESDYNAHTILTADTDNTPAPLTVAEQTLVGRITGGNIDDLSVSDVRTLLNLTYPELQRLTFNAQTGTTYTIVLSDEGKLVTLSNGSAITLTLPQDSDVAIPVGGQVHFTQLGAGQVTFAAGTGATVNGTPGLKCRAQYSSVTAIKRAANTWLLVGDLAA